MKIKTNFINDPISFNSLDLEIGEMMTFSHFIDGNVILLKAYNILISLNNPENTWSDTTEFIGRKLLPGESVTLIQE